jgi:mycoredoxin
MDREGIPFEEINIEQDPESAAYVESVNNGNQLVPTVVVVPKQGGESVAMPNPSLAQVKAALGA